WRCNRPVPQFRHHAGESVGERAVFAEAEPQTRARQSGKESATRAEIGGRSRVELERDAAALQINQQSLRRMRLTLMISRGEFDLRAALKRDLAIRADDDMRVEAVRKLNQLSSPNQPFSIRRRFSVDLDRSDRFDRADRLDKAGRRDWLQVETGGDLLQQRRGGTPAVSEIPRRAAPRLGD